MNTLAIQIQNESGQSENAMQRIRVRLNDLVLEIEQSFAQLAEAAETDPLTRLPRREVVEGFVNKEFLKGNYGSLLILDVDHFKKVNDNYGHPVGDRVLREVADVIRQCCPKEAQLGRIGGEEFALWVPHQNAQEVHALGEWIRRRVASKPLAGIKVTISIGWSEQGNSWKDLYQSADMALYQAKRSGRNRVLGPTDLDQEHESQNYRSKVNS